MFPKRTRKTHCVQCDSTTWRLEALPPSPPRALSTTEWNVSQGQVPPCHHAIPPGGLWQVRPSARAVRHDSGPQRPARAGVQRTHAARVRPSAGLV